MVLALRHAGAVSVYCECSSKFDLKLTLFGLLAFAFSAEKRAGDGREGESEGEGGGSEEGKK